MPFQFNCPNGHLLEALETQAGDQCNCPHCGVLFIIPTPPGAAAPRESPAVTTEVPEVHVKTSGLTTGFDPSGGADEQLLHIPCPNGHVLDVPMDMLQQHVMCPHCQSQFMLREKDSVEYKRRREMQEELREARAGRAWLNWAIAVAVVVAVGLVILIAISSNMK